MSPCPWGGFSQTPSRFCEDAVCGLIQEPANTWSNIGFVIAGVAMLRYREAVPRLIRRFGLVCILVGVGSAAFHATRTYAAGVLDMAGMQAAAAFILAGNARRLFPARAREAEADRRDARRFWTIAAVGIAISVAFEQHGRTLFGMEMVVAGIMEIELLRRATLERAHLWLAMSWTTFVTASVLWWLDVRGTACNGSAHIVNGHAGWHLFLAMSLFAVQRFHAALARPREMDPASAMTSCR